MTSNEDVLSEQFQISRYNEKYLHSVNRKLFERESSSSMFERQFGEKLQKEEKLYIILGTDSGLLPTYLLQNKTPKNTRYLFIELPYILDKIKENIPTNYDKNTFQFTTLDKWQETAEAFEINVYIYKDSIEYIKSFSAIDSFLIDYHSTNLKVIKELESIFFFTRALVGVFPFMTRQLVNISENKNSLTLLNNLFKGKTCVILGGGPSLDNDLEWIKENQENLVIIAVSRVSKTLLKNNITPHMVVCVDPYDVSFDVSKELLLMSKEVLFINANCVTSPLLSQWSGRNVCIGARFPWKEESDENCSIVGGPTVTNTALKAAIEMGFANILLTGVDLCYSSSGVTHAKDSNEAKVGPTLGQPGIWVQTYAGDKAETQIAFDNAISALSKQAKSALDMGVTIYNLSANAAVAEYIDHIPTSALSFENEVNNAWEIINNALPPESQNSIQEDNNFVLTKVSKILKDIKQIKILAQEALECNEKMFSIKGKESENFKYKLRMDKIEIELDKKYKKASAFVKNFGLDKFIKSLQTSHEDWSDDQVKDTGQIYYQAYIDSSTTLIKHLEDTVNRIKSRKEEEKTSPDIAKLFEQWEKDKHFGRVKVWQTKHPEYKTILDNNYASELERFNTKFQDILSDEESQHMKKMKRESSLDGVKRKIVILFNQKNIDALKVLTHSLKLYDKNNHQAQELYINAEAYLAILKQDHQSALNYFDQLDADTFSEDELQQIAFLGINLSLYEKTSWALEKLSSISAKFTPQYGKVLNLLGEYDKSINVYSKYLADYPEDLMTWLALGKVYIKINAVESAQLAFKHVLAKEPNNINARELLQSITDLTQ
ncbi:6-hydroxymethylpterin diphosphokinase MptE-like protein [Colwellia sp. UCD-KL20]|uniref:6-hydroxymethylpterin diphosphokinase MptE-like protein n=1 Tax=Colwellia sp. UCD-KL20 TaxID=1917165 RepID=UPI0009703015|nr:6-hydroxymethylpterin diphosphokinase MptE-like protein [Colwellia sp. UCD-KL20]